MLASFFGVGILHHLPYGYAKTFFDDNVSIVPRFLCLS